MGNVSKVGGNNAVETASFANAETAEVNTNAAPESINFLPQSAEEKTLFNQAELTRTALQQTPPIPRMDAASEANLAKINPQLADRIRLMAADLRAQGITIRATSSYRTFAEQNALYAQGRTKPGSIVTNARGGQSLHNYGLAVDVVPLNSKGQPDWNVPSSVWQKIGAAGKNQGMEWGGDWKSFVDRPHFQMTAGRSVSSLLGQYNQNGGNLSAIWNDVNRHYPNVGGTSVPTTPTVPTTPAGNVLRAGSRGEAVAALQRDLSRLGYPLTADGVFGSKTEAAVKRFQREHGLPADGIVGSKTEAAIEKAKNNVSLPVPAAKLQKGERGEQVKQLQNALVRLGFLTKAQMNTGPGIFGEKTDAALRAFQRSQDLTADGIYGPRTRAALTAALG
jgi:peptidoglycan L-alanyl-D-glutamate endopeptidase CwlK